MKMAEKKEEKESKEEYEVTILSRNFFSLFPKIAEKHENVSVLYVYADYPPSTVIIDLFKEFGAEKQEEVKEQISKEKGPLFEKYLEIEKKAIREDIEKRVLMKPKVVKV
jgi:CRISPR/Cas system CMR-associated protein Cmr1 (group 7 of RAMP superfamily)